MGCWLLKKTKEAIVSEPREHIEQIRNDFQASQRVKDSLNNSIQALAHDLYSKETHFIFELIQNAEDNTYKETEPSLCFRLVKTDPTNTQNAAGALIIQNNETGFTPDNVDAICAVGKTTKSKIRGFIGEKGIGFKSVFRVTTIPHIFSNGYQFCFPEKDEETGLGYIVPRWVNSNLPAIAPIQTTIVLPLDKPDFGYEIIEEMLLDIEPETILFLSKLKEIQIITESGDDLSILKDDTKNPKIQLLIEGQKQGKSYSEINEFLLYTKSVDKPAHIDHEKRIDIDKRDVSIVFAIGENIESVGKIFAYLPVRSDTGLPFLMNADFILPSSREEIREKTPWNQWLMGCVANLLADTLPQLKEKRLLTVNLLEALAKRMNELDESSIFYPIAVAVRDALLDRELLPADDKTFVSARNAKLARSAELRKLISHDQLRELFQPDADIKWLSGKITQDRTPDLRYYLINDLDIEEVTPDGFVRKLSLPFLASQSDEWFIRFYMYLSGQEALWRSPRWRGDTEGVLRIKPILRLQDDSHKMPFRSDGTPNAFLPPPEDTDFPIVKREIVGNEKVGDFLKRLGLSEPDVFDDIVERVLPKYNRPDASSISQDEHSVDLQKILRAMFSDSEAGKKKVLRAARQTPFLMAIDQRGDVSFRKPGEVYAETSELRRYFSGAAGVWFLNEPAVGLYSESDPWAQLGVTHLPRRIQFSDDLPVGEKEYSTRGETIENFDLHGLKEFLESLQHISDVDKQKELSCLLWGYLVEYLEANPRFFKGRYQWFYYNSQSKLFDCMTLTRLQDAKWVPTKEDGIQKPVEIMEVQLLDECLGSNELIDILGIQRGSGEQTRHEHARELGVSLEDIELMKEHSEEFNQWKATISAQKQKPAFPERASSNPERRREKLEEQMGDAPKKEYEQRDRSERITSNAIDKDTYLRNAYTNNDGQMVCQICKEEMPFRKRDGEYCLVAVEALSGDYFTKEHEAQYLALCPLCAAMYQEFVKKDKDSGIMESLKSELMNSQNTEISLRLGDLKTSIRFVESHFLDIRTIIEYPK